MSLSFRLYGNIFAGENMLEAMSTMVPGLGWLLPIPFYFMELLVGLVQAVVFMLLTAVFTLLICQPTKRRRRERRTDESPAACRRHAAGGRGKDNADDWQLARRPGSARHGDRRGMIGMGASTAVGRNPGASTKIMVQSILAIAFAEAVAFYALFLVQ